MVHVCARQSTTYGSVYVKGNYRQACFVADGAYTIQVLPVVRDLAQRGGTPLQ